MKNNKGQVLVLFVIIFPIVLILLMVMIEVGSLYIDKQRTKGIIRETIVECLDNDLSNSMVNELIDSNIDDISEKSVFTSENEVKVNLKQDKKLFGKRIIFEYRFNGIKLDDKITISEG